MSTQPVRRVAQKAMGMSRAVADAIVAKMKTTSQYGWLALADMKVDQRAQRVLRRVWVKRHVSQFDANQIGTIVISRRSDGSLWVIDGQHRVELLRAVKWGDQSVYCEIFDNLTIQEEAALFLKRNDKISVRTFDKFMVGRTEQNASVCAIFRIVSDCGMTIAEGNRDGSISATTALQRVFHGAGVASEREGAAALKKALQTIEAAWGKAADGFKGEMIEGVGLVHLRYGSKLAPDSFVAVLMKVRGGATGLITLAKQYRELYGGVVSSALAAVIVQRYNRSRRSGKIDRWQS